MKGQSYSVKRRLLITPYHDWLPMPKDKKQRLILELFIVPQNSCYLFSKIDLYLQCLQYLSKVCFIAATLKCHGPAKIGARAQLLQATQGTSPNCTVLTTTSRNGSYSIHIHNKNLRPLELLLSTLERLLDQNTLDNQTSTRFDLGSNLLTQQPFQTAVY